MISNINNFTIKTIVKINNCMIHKNFRCNCPITSALDVVGDKWSLGFVAETEQQVCEHLEQHQQELPEADQKSRAILNQMIDDERQHGESAKQAGGSELPLPIRQAMSAMSVVMKKTTYRL